MAMVFNKVVSIILALIVLVGLLTGFGLFKAPVTFLAETIARVVQPWGSATPFTETGRDEAYDSVQALMYSINRVAWWDTIEGKDTTEYKSFEKSFNKVNTFPTLYDANAVSFNRIPEDVAVSEIITMLMDCRRMFVDKGKENSYCANLNFQGFTGEITKDEVVKALEAKKKSCDTKDCKDILNNIKEKKLIFNSELKAPKEDVMMCIKTYGWGNFRIYFTDNVNDCALPDDDLKFKFGMKVEDFLLPQEFSDEDNSVAYKIEDWVGINGDPKYIMYYEHFPEGEDKYWHPAAYKVDYITIITVEGLFMVLDFIPFGKLMKKLPIIGPILESVQEGLSKVFSKPKQIVSVMKEFVDEKLPRMFGKIAPEFFEKLVTKLNTNNKFLKGLVAKELVLESGEKGINNVVSEILEQQGKELGEDFVQKELKEHILEKTQKEFLPEILEKFGEDTLDEAGTKLSKEAAEELQQKLINELREIGVDELSDEAAEKLLKSMDTVLELDDFMKVARRAKLASASADYYESIIKKLKEGDAKALNNVYDNLNFLDDMKPADFAKYQQRIGEAVDDSLERQLKHVGLMDSSNINPEDFAKLTQIEKESILDEQMEQLFKDNGIDTSYFKSKRFWSAVKGYTSKKRHLVTAMAVILNDRLLSINEKFTPVGTNAIGVRTPFLATEIYDDTYTNNFEWPEDKTEYEDFFNYYAGYGDHSVKNENGDEVVVNEDRGTKYKGLLSEVGRYYISLQKDQKTFWSDQPNDRFHLVSPCKADVYVRVTNCECYGKPRTDTIGDSSNIIGSLFEHPGVYETGQYNPELEEIVPNFDGSKKMLYTIGENGVIVKKCDPPGIWQEVIGKEAEYTPQCIVINPVLDPEYPNNYCYHGKTSVALQAANIALNYVGPITASVVAVGATATVCAPLGPLVAACEIVFPPLAGGVSGMIDGIVYANLALNEAWPNHINPGGNI